MDQDTFNKLMMGVDLDQALDQATKDAMQQAIAISPTQQAIIDNDRLVRQTQINPNTQIDQPETLNNNQIKLSNVPKNLGNYLAEKLYLKESPGRRAERLRGDLYQYQATDVQNEMMQDQLNASRNNFAYTNFLELRNQIDTDSSMSQEKKNYLLGLDQDSLMTQYGAARRPLNDTDRTKYGLASDVIGTIDNTGQVYVDKDALERQDKQEMDKRRDLTRQEKIDRDINPNAIYQINDKTGQTYEIFTPTIETGMVYNPDNKKVENVPGGKKDITDQATLNAAERLKRNEIGEISFISNKLDRAMQIITQDTGGVPTTGSDPLGMGVNVLKYLPGSDSNDLRNTLETIKGFVARDALKEMRLASPTGGALGNVSNFEVEMLMAAMGNLNQDQSRGQLLENLGHMKFLLRIITDPKRVAEGAQQIMYQDEQITYMPDNPEDAQRYINIVNQFSQTTNAPLKLQNKVFGPQGVVAPQIGSTNLQQLTDEQLQEELARLEGQL
jgi:hypothetical protein